MERVIAELHWLGASRFWSIWLISTFTLVSLTVAVIRRAPSLPINPSVAAGNASGVIRPARWRVYLVVASALILSSYIFTTLIWEDFSYYDDNIFTMHTLRGHAYPPPIWVGAGRFFPLSHQEFNVIRLFAHSIFGYHVFVICELLIFYFSLLAIDPEMPLHVRGLLAVLTLLSSGVLASFTALIFAERNLVLLFSSLMISLWYFEKSGTSRWAAATVALTQLILYYKETSAVLIMSLAMGRILLRTRARERGTRCILADRAIRLDLSMITCAALYLLYYGIMRVDGGESYAAVRNHPYGAVALAYASTDFAAVTLLIAVLIRGASIARRRATPWILWDSAAISGLVCAAAYICLGLYSWYYLTIVDVIAVLYVGRLVVLILWPNLGGWARSGLLAILALVMMHDIGFSLYSLYEEKNIVRIKTEIADLIEQRYSESTTLRLFFPFASPYAISEFAAYLDYRHIPSETLFGSGVARREVILVTPRASAAHDPAAYTYTAPDGRCVMWSPFLCRTEEEPSLGDIIVILPDDQSPGKKLSGWTESGAWSLFEPFPKIPRAVIRLFLGPEAPVRFERRKVPDGWLVGAVAARR